MTHAEVVTVDDRLSEIADEVRALQSRGRSALEDAVETYFAIGHCLQRARMLTPSTQAYGEWLRSQGFTFTTQWGGVLMAAAEHEPAVRAAIESQLSIGRSPNFDKAVKQVRAAIGDGRDERPALHVIGAAASTEFPCIVIDPPWRYDNVATRGAAEDHYPTMSLDDLADLELPAAANAHLYLWVTNGFIRQGFDLLDAWDFTYKTILTWCKPQIGMGNWFRNSTEHVLFATRGKLPTLRNDCPTHFVANRTKHSAKPESFYDLVESCSPGPWLEMFARRRRFHWDTWGNEA